MKSFAAHVARPGRSRNTVRLALAPLRAMLADAAEAGDIRQNPARGVRIGNLTKSPAAAPVKSLKPSEAATLIAALPDRTGCSFGSCSKPVFGSARWRRCDGLTSTSLLTASEWSAGTATAV